MDCPPGSDFFLKNFSKNLRFEIDFKGPRTVRPMGPDCPPHLLKIFNEALFIKRIRHSSKMQCMQILDQSGAMKSQANEIDPS
jgi:hypothetical protein